YSIRVFIPPPAIRRRVVPSRSYAVQSPGNLNMEVFNRKTKLLQKERAARDVETSRRVDYLRDEVASRLCERLLDINRSYDHILDYGANACNIARILTQPLPHPTPTDPDNTIIAAPRISKITAAESSRNLLYRDQDLPFNSEIEIVREELNTQEVLPYPQNTFDAVLSSLSLHWTNDLPSVLAQINNILKPDAPFLGVMLGGDSIYELRTSLQLADMDIRGGVSTHTSPLADVRDVGGLLQSARFKLLTVDIDDIIIDYPTMTALVTDLQAMGESNAVLAREPGPIQRDVLLAAEAIYKELHGNDDGTLPATFRLIYMIGWKEAANQAKPLERGTGMFSIKDYLEGSGKKAGDG
ncbi:S-adenosyl-L-methionine-dependent methyltransferase, partial [Patellaria atrata CBS 101060]